MKAHNGSGSKTDLLLECQYWARSDVELPPDEVGQPGKDGNATHAIGEAFLNGYVSMSSDTPLADICAEHGGDLERVERLWQSAHAAYRALRNLHGANMRAEVAFMYRADGTVDELERVEHRDYGDVQHGELPATADVVIGGDVPTVLDLKTGDQEYLPAPEMSGQLRTLGLMVARRLGAASVTVGFIVAFDDGSAAEARYARLDSLDLEIFEMRLKGALAGIQTAKPRPGAHCDWCPLRTTCPATVTSLASVAEMPLQDVERLAASSIQTPEDAGKAYVRLKVIRDAVRAVESRIKEVIETHGPAPSRPGKRLTLASKSRETFSQERLRAGVKDPDAVLGLLRESGAIQKSEWTELREVKAS